MGILDAFKSGGFVGIGEELGRRLGFGVQIASLPAAQQKQALSDIAILKGQAPTQGGASLDWYTKTLIAVGTVVLGVVVVSKSMK